MKGGREKMVECSNSIPDIFEQKMEKYEKICLLDSGTYGEVYKCRSRDRDQIVAIKR